MNTPSSICKYIKNGNTYTYKRCLHQLATQAKAIKHMLPEVIVIANYRVPIFVKTKTSMDSLTDKEAAELIESLSHYNLDDGLHYHATDGINDGLILNKNYIDALFVNAAYIVVKEQYVVVSFIQRQLMIGYNHAERIMNQLKRAGIVSNIKGHPYKVNICSEEELETFINEYLKDKKQPFSYHYMEWFIDENKEEISRVKEERLFKEEKEKARKKIIEKERKKSAEREALQELIEEGLVFVVRKTNEKSREPIPKDVMNQVWNRDGGACVECGGKESLEFDHIIPVSKGGTTTYPWCI